jgi:hypothetical protein
MRTINVVLEAYLTRRYTNFRIGSIQRRVEKVVGRPVPTETVKRALRKLREEGIVDYTYNRSNHAYVTNS